MESILKPSKLKIGISACFFHPDPKRQVFKGKTLLYVEQSMLNWVHQAQAWAYMVPALDYVSDLDGLILHGGADVAPETYGETPLKPEWCGDAIRDRYEIGLLKEFIRQGKPVLGVCRGLQLMNVAFGGTLYQDIGTQLPGALIHRNGDLYDQNFHTIRFEPGSRLQELYPKSKEAKVNSIHHQGIRKLGKGCVVEATSLADGVIEAIRLDVKGFVAAIQWHPEFHDSQDETLLKSDPLLHEFFREADQRRQNRKE